MRSEGYVCVSVAGDGDGVSVGEGAAAELEGEVNSYIEVSHIIVLYAMEHHIASFPD